jgi:hypothetical protein
VFGLDANTLIVYEPMLDLLPANGFKREMFAVSFDQWTFGFEDILKRPGNLITVHESIPGLPDKMLIDGYLETGYACADLGLQGHGYGFSIP